MTNIYFMDSTGFRIIEAPVVLTAEQALTAVKNQNMNPIDNRVLVTYSKGK